MCTHAKIYAATSIFLVLVIMVSSFSWKPREAVDQGPIYSGSLWRGMIPVEYLSNRALEGRLSYGKVSTPHEFIVGVDQTETWMAYSTTYTLRTQDGSTYYLVTNEHKPITDNRYEDILNASKVYIKGNFFNYLSPNGRVLRMIDPIEVTVEPVRDLVEASSQIIMDIVGERYFNNYFSSPILWKDEWEPSRMYTVEYVYRCEVIREPTPRTVSLIFNSDRMLVDQRGIPDEDSLQPFSVSKQEAVMIARDHGFPGQGEPRVNVSTYTRPSEWSSLADNITLQTYYDPSFCAEPINLSHYLWYVDQETSPEGANPEAHKYAVVDANKGAMYLISEIRFCAISTMGPGDLFDPETALGHGIPGYVNVDYAEEAPRLVIVSPGKDVTLRVVFTLVSHTGNFSEAIVVLDPESGTGHGIDGVYLNDYISYEPAMFILRLGEPLEVDMTCSVPDGLPGFSAHSEDLLGVGVHAEVPVKAGRGGSYSPEDLSWAYAALGSPLGKPAWLMVNRFSVSSHPETIVEIESINFDRYPRILEAFEVEEKSHLHFPHPYEWVNCTNREGVEIVELLGDRYVASDRVEEGYYFDIRYSDINYSVTIIFSWNPPGID